MLCLSVEKMILILFRFVMMICNLKLMVYGIYNVFSYR